jgi:hypothetical protein
LAPLSTSSIQKALAVLLSLAATVAVAGCGGATSGPLPEEFMVCGQRLWTYGAFAPATLTYAKPGRFRLPIRPTASSPVLLRFADDCGSGVRLGIDHAGVVTIHARARADDGLIAGISILARRRGRTTLTATHPSGATTRVEIRLR